MDTLNDVLSHPWMHTLLGCVALLLVAWLARWVARHVLVRIMRVISRRTVWQWDDAMVDRGVFHRLAHVVPLLVIRYGVLAVPGVGHTGERAISGIVYALIAVVIVWTAFAALSAAEDFYRTSPRGQEHTIKGYVQLAKIMLFVIGAIVVIAALIGRSPLTLLAGLGAISAVLLLIFKDTILSVVASIQLGTNDMLRVGDWIAVPGDGADGDVIEIALHTVKVRNWDKTVSTVPTWHLISQSYRNYRQMYETGRRIRRALHIDLTTVRFLTSEEIDHLRQFRLLDGYFERKEKEIADWNASLGTAGKAPMNRRRLSNLGTFRAYMQAYVKADPNVNHDLFWAVRQLDPGPTGIPIQIYGYTVETGFVAHENAQGDLFDHLITILPEFGLSLFQQPTGVDMRVGLGTRPGTGKSATGDSFPRHPSAPEAPHYYQTDTAPD